MVKNKETQFATVRYYGLEYLYTLLIQRYRIIIAPRKTLGYQRDDCDGGVGRGNNTVLPNRKGEIFDIDVSPNGSYPPSITEMAWYTGGLNQENIAMFVVEENGIEDLLVIDLIPPKQAPPQDVPRQLMLS